VHFDLRSRKKIGQKIIMVGTNGNKFKEIRSHFENNIKYKNMDLNFINYPKENEKNNKAYI
jgi:hypothetical protein